MNEDVYRLLAGKGRNGDTELAHITKEESNILKMLGGAGTTNPWTGLSEYHGKWGIGKKKHPRHHTALDLAKQAAGTVVDTAAGFANPVIGAVNLYEDVVGETGVATPGEIIQGDPLVDPSINAATGLPKTEQELLIEQRQLESQQAGETLLTSGQTIGEMGLGQEALTAEQYQGMTPQQIVDDIFAKQYDGQVPPDMAVQGITVDQFKAQIAGKLKNMPQFKGADPEALGFQQETKELAGRRAESAWDATKYGLQGQAGKVGSMLQSGYGGSGVGMRGAIGAQGLIGKGFGAGLESRDIALDTADLGFRKGVYGLEQHAGAGWETDYSSFLGTLPSPV